MSPKELLEQLNELDEHRNIEAKTASELGKSALETICAFSNEPGLGGGWLLLGAKAEEDALFRQYVAIGVPDLDKLTRDLVTQCANVFNHPIRIQLTPGLVNGKQLLAVYVSEVEPGSKPVFLKSRGLPTGAFRRIGSSDVHCTDDDLAIFFQDRRGEAYDSTIIRDAGLDSLDDEAVWEYRRLRTAANPSAEELRWNDEELLHALGCISKDGDILRPTVGGMLLFGKPQALRRWFPLMRVDYIRVPGRDWVQDTERRFDTVELRSPLISLIRRAHAAILDDLPKAFSLPPGQLHRKDIPLIPDRVIREAVVNAVMHRSYRLQGAIQIIRYANRLEIRNPGHSLVSEDRLGEPGSETRNPSIAAVLHDTNLAETKGSGIRVMRELMDSIGLTPPTFESDRERNQFVVTLLFHHFLSPEDWVWLRQFQACEISDEEARALIFVREAGAITNAAYRSINRVDVLNASTHLRRLRKHGLLLQQGKGAETFYIPTEKLMNSWRENGNLMPIAGEFEAKTGNLPIKTGGFEAKTGEFEAKTGESNSKSWDLPDDLRSEIESLGKKVSQEIMENLVIRLCRWQPLSKEALASHLSRNANYVQDKLLTPLIRSGRLTMTIPQQPNHPQQKYRTPDLADKLG